MKSKNIPASIKSKSIKDAKNEINTILSKLENKDTNFEASIEDYKRLIQLNEHVDNMFKSRMKEINRMKEHKKTK
ncbi:MAG: Exonuclease VII small subunit [Pelagibacterales bacterium]|nr:Exonuclease VII small subunit [Pelagibacterales bacterium]